MAETIADLFRDVEQFQREVVGWTGVNNTAAERRLCVKLIAEELAEYDEAWESGNRLAIIHEAVDLVYVCVGAVIRTCRKEDIDVSIEWYDTDGFANASGFTLASEIIRELKGRMPYDVAKAVAQFVEYYDDFYFYEAWDRIHAANMKKKDGPVINGKKCKPEGWQPADLSDLIDETNGMQYDA